MLVVQSVAFYVNSLQTVVFQITLRWWHQGRQPVLIPRVLELPLGVSSVITYNGV